MLLFDILKNAGGVANVVNPDQMLHSAVSDLGVNHLLRPVCPNNQSKYSRYGDEFRCLNI